MTPSPTTTKTLFALSNNTCSFSDPDTGSGCEEFLTDPSWESVKAEICHIRGKRPDSARYDENMCDEDRHAFENLILLCPNHHTLIDDLEPKRFTPDVLHAMKARHDAKANLDRPWATETELHRFALALISKQFASGSSLLLEDGDAGEGVDEADGVFILDESPLDGTHHLS